MIFIQLLIMATVGAVIGWTTNVVAIKLLFRPMVPINILGFQLQGLIPKRRDEIVKSVAHTVEKELINIEELFDTVVQKMDKKAILTMLELKIGDTIIANMPALLRSFKGSILKYLHEVIERDGDQLLTEVTERLVHKAVNNISISEIVEERLKSYPLEKIEAIILELAERELVQIERLGGIIGFIVGVLQGIIVIAFF